MFDTHEKSPGKMKFQKPNILRKSPKTKAKAIVKPHTQTQEQTLVEFTKMPERHSPKYTKHKCSKPAHFSKKPLQRLKLDSYVSEEYKIKMEHNQNNFRNDQSDAADNVYEYVQINNNDENTVSSSKNLLDRNFKIEDCVFDVEGITLKSFGDISNNTNWCFIPVNSREKTDYHAVVTRNDFAQVPFEGNTFVPQSTLVVLDSNAANAQDITDTSESIELLPSSTVTFTCDVPECSKEFASEQKLKKHKYVHNRNIAKILKQLSKCPASRPGEEPCDLIFYTRDDLLRHLKNDHTLDDAVYSCADCGRRFFWAPGVRAHARACGARGRKQLACPWPGCGRVFLQPCRLKEHSRAHTGDKPYPCLYPECPWSFRTASKLLRHERQHTGERRHRCEQCGRAFLRGEHLREHRARHARTPRGRRHARAQTESSLLQESPEQKLMESEAASETSLDQSFTEVVEQRLEEEGSWSDTEDPFLSPPPATAPPAASWERCARTHLTWPLAPAPAPAAPAPPPARALEEAVLVLEGDVQVELAEGAESKIYTIRSDLFLHGNILHSEDSESGPASSLPAAAEADAGAAPDAETPLDAELGLLDHSAIELMQDSLLYTEGAVDDSSFQLLSGDLQISSFYTHIGPAREP